MEEILPVFVSSKLGRDFKEGQTELKRQIELFVSQFSEVEPLENYIQLVATKTPKNVDVTMLLKRLDLLV